MLWLAGINKIFKANTEVGVASFLRGFKPPMIAAIIIVTKYISYHSGILLSKSVIALRES